MMPLDLAAYLHIPANAGPQLFLRKPDLGGLEASAAFTLFTSLRDALDQDLHEIPGYHALLLPSAGPGSRGLHAAGRRDEKLSDDEQRQVEALARATSFIAHALEPSEPGFGIDRVAVEIIGGVVKVEVDVRSNDGMRTGIAEGEDAEEAVALAALRAIGTGATPIETRAIEMRDERAAAVLVEREGVRRIATAMAPHGRDPLFAFAVAAVEAASALAPPRT